MENPVVLKDSKQIVGIYIKPSYSTGSIVCSFCSLCIYKKFKTYIPYFFGNNPGRVFSTHNHFAKLYGWPKTLYVNPAARISRDLLRNSGYKLVRDKESADGIIIPSFSDNCYYSVSLNRNIVVYSSVTNYTYLVELSQGFASSYWKDVSFNLLKSKICEFLGQTEDELSFYCNSNVNERFTVYLIPPVDDYYTVLDGTCECRFQCKQRYITDDAIPVVPTFEINIESLEMASRMNITFLEKFLISCPWKEYPFTLQTFLKAEQANNVSNISNKNAKMVLESIEYNRDYSKPITAKDLNMLQDWIFHKIGIDNEKSCFINMAVFGGIHPVYKSVVRAKFAISKIALKEGEEISYRSLCEMIES